MENRVVAARQHREELPPSFDLRKFEKDAALTGALGECLAALEQMSEGVRDTLLAVANRAVVAGTAAYGYIKVSATTSERLKRTVEKLAVRTSSRPADKTAEPVVLPSPAQPGAPVNPIITPTNKAA